MTDLRARLAEAHWELYVSSCRDLASCSHIPATFAELNESEQSYHYRYVDVLLSLPGIAIVELPEATSSLPVLITQMLEDYRVELTGGTTGYLTDQETFELAHRLTGAIIAHYDLSEHISERTPEGYWTGGIHHRPRCQTIDARPCNCDQYRGPARSI